MSGSLFDSGKLQHTVHLSQSAGFMANWPLQSLRCGIVSRLFWCAAYWYAQPVGKATRMIRWAQLSYSAGEIKSKCAFVGAYVMNI
jgi:hypothetical protein